MRQGRRCVQALTEEAVCRPVPKRCTGLLGRNKSGCTHTPHAQGDCERTDGGMVVIGVGRGEGWHVRALGAERLLRPGHQPWQARLAGSAKPMHDELQVAAPERPACLRELPASAGVCHPPAICTAAAATAPRCGAAAAAPGGRAEGASLALRALKCWCCIALGLGPTKLSRMSGFKYNS